MMRAITLATTLSILSVPCARADDLVVLSAAAVKTAVAGVPVAAAATDTVRFVFGTAGAMRDAATAGEAFDVMVAPPAVLADLARRGFVDEGSRVALGTVRLGAAVAKGRPAPDVGTSDAFKRALLEAASIGMADPKNGATSGIYLAKLFGTLGIADAVGPKLRLYPEGQTAMEAVARGEVDLGLGQVSEAAPVAGLEPTASLPASIQLETVYAAALATKSAHPEAARRLLGTLRAPAIRASFAANGFEVTP